MPLAELIDFPETVSIVPHTGVQFIDIGFNLEKSPTIPVEWGFRDDAAGRIGDDLAPVLVHRGGDGAAGASYGVNHKQLLALAERQWLPLPLLREEPGGGWFRGPTNWARGYLVPLAEPDRDGKRWRLVLALDTNLLAFYDNEAYLAPSPDDAKNGKSFSLPPGGAGLDWYLREAWVKDWLLDVFKEMIERDERRRTGRKRAQPLTLDELRDRMDGPHEHLARYLAWLDLLHALEILPRLRIVDRVTAPRAQPIDVDLVLDLGNSRSCGLLIERHPGELGTDVTQAFKLQLRDLTRPELVHAEPFDSRLEFARASFGRDQHSLRSGRGDAFAWPTVVRVGPEAVRLSGRRRGSEGNTGMSSPKRYLWDREQRKQSWRFGDAGGHGDHGDFATGAAFTTLVNEVGEAIHRVPHATPGADPRWFPAIRALYARSHLMSFALAEIFFQAMTMMNAAAHRLRRRNADLPRRLSRIILTMPTAMALAERRLFQERAEAARDLVHLCLGLETRPPADGTSESEILWTDDITQPQVLLRWDEASATQAVYLFSEIAINHSGDARGFFAAMRQPARQAEKADDLRLATLDIGGGTTDLVVTRFRAEGAGNNVTIMPEQLFREGFSLAGDEAVLRVVRDHVLDPIRAALGETALGARAETVLQNLVGGDRGDMDVAEQLRRRQFAVQIAQPIALALMTAYESYDPFRPVAVASRGFADLLPDSDAVPPDLIDWFNREVAQAGAAGFDLRALRFAVDLAEIDRSIRAVFTEPLQALAEVIWRERSDLLLLSGRPSRLPAVRTILLETGTLPPHRVLPLHRVRVGGWYPFRDADGRIGDPKTTAAVGALICLLAEGRLQNFSFRADRLTLRSTARVFGKLDRGGRLHQADEFYRDLDLDDEDRDLPQAPFEFRMPMALGFRQLPVDWWPATRLYTLDWSSAEMATKYYPRTPLQVTLARRLDRGRASEPGRVPLRVIDSFAIAEIVDAEGGTVARTALDLKLQTLDREDGYWLDTGVLTEQ
jgi:hypothetical protein